MSQLTRGKICCRIRLVAAVIVAGVAGIGRLPAQEPSKAAFTFTNVDLKLLEECKALDREFEVRALVYHDSAMDKHLVDIATPLLPTRPLGHVEWRFHILRDPMVNAFALPNGSIYVNTGLLGARKMMISWPVSWPTW